nr:hypothetical protein 25 [Burkholderiaceae bacterium]
MNFNSPEWHGLKKYIEEQLEKARIKNDSSSLNEIDTAALRGEIRVLKRILALPETTTREVEVYLDT